MQSFWKKYLDNSWGARLQMPMHPLSINLPIETFVPYGDYNDLLNFGESIRI